MAAGPVDILKVYCSRHAPDGSSPNGMPVIAHLDLKPEYHGKTNDLTLDDERFDERSVQELTREQSLCWDLKEAQDAMIADRGAKLTAAKAAMDANPTDETVEAFVQAGNAYHEVDESFGESTFEDEYVAIARINRDRDAAAKAELEGRAAKQRSGHRGRHETSPYIADHLARSRSGKDPQCQDLRATPALHLLID